MAQRRSLNSAMTLTPDKMAFIQGKSTPEQTTQVQTEEPPMQSAVAESVSALEAAAEVRQVREARERPIRQRRSAAPRSNRNQEPTPHLEHFRVGVTVRIHPEIADALRRAHLEQKIRRESPGTQQEIVESALSDWLERNGYLENR